LGLSLGGFQAVLQSSLFDGVAFDPFPFQYDGLATTEVDIGWRQVLQAFVVAAVIVVLDEAGDPGLEHRGRDRVDDGTLEADEILDVRLARLPERGADRATAGLAVSRARSCAADDDASAQSRLPRRSRSSRDQQARVAPHLAAQLRHPSWNRTSILG
jgi:hypothetical protein